MSAVSDLVMPSCHPRGFCCCSMSFRGYPPTYLSTVGTSSLSVCLRRVSRTTPAQANRDCKHLPPTRSDRGAAAVIGYGQSCISIDALSIGLSPAQVGRKERLTVEAMLAYIHGIGPSAISVCMQVCKRRACTYVHTLYLTRAHLGTVRHRLRCLRGMYI